MPAVTAIASAPQNVTRIAPIVAPAPPTRAANPPNRARNAKDVPETGGSIPPLGDKTVASSGLAAPKAKLPTEAKADWIGRARKVSEMPSSS